MFDNAGKEAGLDAAKELHSAADTVSSKVDDVAKDLGLELADAVNVMAGSLNRLESTLGAESAAWRGEISKLTVQVSRFADFLDRVQIVPPKA